MEPPFPLHSPLGDPGPVLGLITCYTTMTQPWPPLQALEPYIQMLLDAECFGSIFNSRSKLPTQPCLMLVFLTPFSSLPPSPPDPTSSTVTRTVHSIHHRCHSPSSRLQWLFTWAPAKPPSWPSCFCSGSPALSPSPHGQTHLFQMYN